MTNEEKELYLSVLVEMQLFTIVKAIEEGNVDGKGILKEKQIKKFVNELPKYLSEIPNVEQKIRNILEITEKNYEEGKKLRKENDRKRDLGEER